MGSPSSDTHATEDHGSILKARRRFFLQRTSSSVARLTALLDFHMKISHDCVCASLGVGNAL